MQEQEGNTAQDGSETMESQESVNQETPVEKEEAPREAQGEALEEEPTPKRLRRVLLWAVAVLFVFGLGVGSSWWLQIKPQADEIDTLQAQVATAESDLTAAQSELEDLRPLELENESLKAELKASKQHLDLLFVLVDVSTAQLGMLQEDILAAKAALSGTDDRLASLQQQLSAEDAQTVSSLRDRVTLVIEEADSDAFAARRDLEILANNLLSLERLLFGP